MPCYYPIPAWETLEGEIHFHPRGTSGKKAAKAPNYRREITIPCGRCIGCRLESSRQWALRIMHEAQLHEQNSFITLTYGGLTTNQYEPIEEEENTAREEKYARAPDSLIYRHFQLFMKRARKQMRRKLRFYMCGEYGDDRARPHYHCALFGADFSDDRVIHSEKQGATLWRSPTLEQLWPWGYSTIGELNFETASYVANYVTKKVSGPKMNDAYMRVDPMTGELYWLTPEFAVMSRKPGIGHGWITKYSSDVYPHDKVYTRDHPSKPPRYYDQIMAARKPEMMEAIKEQRATLANYSDATPERLSARETVTKARLALKKRNL